MTRYFRAHRRTYPRRRESNGRRSAPNRPAVREVSKA